MSLLGISTLELILCSDHAQYSHYMVFLVSFGHFSSTVPHDITIEMLYTNKNHDGIMKGKLSYLPYTAAAWCCPLSATHAKLLQK